MKKLTKFREHLSQVVDTRRIAIQLKQSSGIGPKPLVR